MKFEQARIELVPRSVGNCLDLALVLCGRHLPALCGLWALFTVPLAAITYAVAYFTTWGWLAALVCGVFGSAPFGVMLVSGVARMTFGEELSLAEMLRHVREDFTLMLQILGLRFPLFLLLTCLLPAALLAVRWGFLVESHVLTKLHESRHDRRTKELINLEFSDLFVRGAAITLAGAGSWFILELTVDVVWTILFSQSIFFGRFSEVGNMMSDYVDPTTWLEHAWKLAASDPAVLVLHLSTGLAVYAVCRVAWFLCYIDLRVRRDCWDLELEILDEARHLGAELESRPS